jgi:hypothetical protein
MVNSGCNPRVVLKRDANCSMLMLAVLGFSPGVLMFRPELPEYQFKKGQELV